jgi:hypothetical protein
VATSSQVRTAARKYAQKKRDIDRLTDLLIRTRLEVYERTLRDVVDQLGADRDVQLSPRVRAQLNIEARRHARLIARNFNDALAEYAVRVGPGLSDQELRRTLALWAENRNQRHAPLIAVTEAWGPHADATMAAFLELGLDDARFDFGGHPDDSPPACDICQALVDTNPHPLTRVLQIGVPHPQCEQRWRVRGKPRVASTGDEPLGQRVAGVIGRDTLIQRAGSREAAVRAIRSGSFPR